MKILAIAPTYYPHMGGAERSFYELYSKLLSYGINVDLVTPNLAKRLNLKTKYREVHREDDFNKHVTISLKSRYSFSEYLRSYSFFIDNKDFDKIFQERTDGQILGFKIYTRPHVAVDVEVRYRQQYQDKDGDGEIQDDDVERNFTLNIIIDTDYWWEKYKDRKKDKD